MSTILPGYRVQVRGRWRAGDGTVVRMTTKSVVVKLDGDRGTWMFRRKSVRPIRWRGVRLPWEESE